MTGGTLKAANIISTTRGSFTFEGGEITLTGDRRAILAEAWFHGIAGTTASYDSSLDRTLIQVSSGTPFSLWAASAGIPENERGADQDPDHDGVSNLLEFALGGQPGEPGSRGIHTPVGTPGGAVITVAVRAGASFGIEEGRLVAVIDGVRYEIQGSADLGTWDAPVEEVAPALTQGVEAAPSAEWELRSFRLAGTAGESGSPLIFFSFAHGKIQPAPVSTGAGFSRFIRHRKFGIRHCPELPPLATGSGGP
jgi:hypothetical protein